MKDKTCIMYCNGGMIFVGKISKVDLKNRQVTLDDEVTLRFSKPAQKGIIEAFAKQLTMRFTVPLEEVDGYEEEGKWFGAVSSWSKHKDELQKGIRERQRKEGLIK